MDHEYYSTVYTWFEKCGIISNIRTHLRQNLISALKNKDLTLKRDNPKSAKQYVYDLLVAEYLFNHNYAYTLSVFASEAPLLINFHDGTAQKLETDNEQKNREKLQIDYILHTLETLGINPRDAQGQYIISQYVNNDVPLLLCILKCTSAFSFNAQVKEEKSFCNEFTQTEFSWQLGNSDVEGLRALKKKIFQHKEVVDNKLREREMKLKEQAVIIEQQFASLNEKLHQIQNVMHSISLKEKQLKEQTDKDDRRISQKEMELSVKERFLLDESNRLKREESNSRKFEQYLKTLQEELSKIQRDRPRKEANVNCSTTATPRNVEVQTELDKQDQIKILTKEKEELLDCVQKQQLRIEQITQRAMQLSRQIVEIQALRPTSADIPTQTVNANTIISESSSTEDILQDAKLRLRRLEEESMKADQYYYHFINTSS